MAFIPCLLLVGMARDPVFSVINNRSVESFGKAKVMCANPPILNCYVIKRSAGGISSNSTSHLNRPVVHFQKSFQTILFT